MRHRRIFASCLFLLQAPCAAKCIPLPEAVNRYIVAITDQFRGGESCESRQVVRGDIDNDGTTDLIVLFHVEGACLEDRDETPGACSGGYTSMITVFLGGKLKEVSTLTIGTKGSCSVRIIRVRNGVIEARTLCRGPVDPWCCPSVKGKTSFILLDGVLTERRLYRTKRESE